MPESEVLEGQAVEVEEVRHLPAVQAHEAMITKGEITVEELVQQAGKIEAVMDAAMKEGVHYGNIPGIKKPTLLKAGAEKLNVLLRLSPSYKSERTFHDGGHLTVVSICTLTHIPTGFVIAEGEGLCSTYEAKYAYRQGKRTCPDCGADAIVRSTRKKAYFCISAEGGCGNRFAFDTVKAKALDDQDTSRVDNPELPDTWNTVLKMADKRALVAAVLNGTAASDVFTQDVEESFSRGNDQPFEAGSMDQRPFDPGNDLLEGAVGPGEGFERKLAQRMDHLDPTLDWGAVIKQVWDKERTPEFWRRLSNCLEWTHQAAGADRGDFPPVAAETIIAGFAFAFEGKVVELVWKQAEPELPVVDDGIPFGDDEPPSTTSG